MDGISGHSEKAEAAQRIEYQLNEIAVMIPALLRRSDAMELHINRLHLAIL